MAEDMEEGGSDEAAPVWMTQEPFETQESALDMAGESLALVSDVTDMGQSARDLADRQAEVCSVCLDALRAFQCPITSSLSSKPDFFVCGIMNYRHDPNTRYSPPVYESRDKIRGSTKMFLDMLLPDV